MRVLLSRILSVALFGILTLFLTLSIQGVWSGLVVANLQSSSAIPWAVGLMAVLLWLGWLYADGKGWPASTASRRHAFMRANRVPLRIFGWALLAGGLSMIALIGYWIVMVQLVKMPPHNLPNYSIYPYYMVALVLLMASVVGAVVEEVGFRGYFQVSLEPKLNPLLAVVITAVLLSPGHGLTQGFVWPVLLWYFCADSMFGALAYLTNSILPGIFIHGIGLMIFFSLIWPGDSSRKLFSNGGGDSWFWIHAVQAIIFSALAILAFRQLARIRSEESQPPRAGL